MVVVIPCTSNVAAKRPRAIPVTPTKHNGLSAPSVFLINQLIAIDTEYLVHKIGSLETPTMQDVQRELQDYLGL